MGTTNASDQKPLWLEIEEGILGLPDTELEGVQTKAISAEADLELAEARVRQAHRSTSSPRWLSLQLFTAPSPA